MYHELILGISGPRSAYKYKGDLRAPGLLPSKGGTPRPMVNVPCIDVGTPGPPVDYHV